MNYFDLFPDIELPSFSDKRRSSFDYIRIKNLFKRGRVRDDIYGNVIAFSKYLVLDGERPDTVAKKLYEDENLDWIILLSNNMINVQDEWPMGQFDFQRYLDNKYSKDQLGEIHHYETNEIRNQSGILLLQKGLIVDADYTFKYTEIDGSVQTVNSVKSISNIQFEIDKNDAKRSINVLRKEYIGVLIDDMRQIMTYTDSSQFINRKLKKGENLRIAEPR
tara:strand:+ start:501 stop:1160 length:660 start_codon:yes stop_codon:yes gene_type:complete